ncbi:PREDICTED: dolichyl pyrophosphate Man9GlcNAc2 alpha-1,3-glucosyltransferase-like isoform X1 [Polistes dominula]|uniref:Alpha-1,3-glucosyltransferase n=1 Tax=Polistes dominula TaxID=743375 RepID=A0ABM1I948_POLDO|nr:PREDICTED: dolichyl pyrophosphate Man9GlcNAc2 alpha-1,3-glucosyltransferase-like isoform X1 [Polistes dominula]XP_015176735.1 PREDICTED: dolichyl pyrophosphate Man9GlcNAc2 alpha-1,3-glucosyltransferase-like isoform X1 [Polistes dominula]
MGLHGSMQVVLIFIFALILRWCITYHSHSGQDKPPMYGDYEAQRHWQEITLNLPIQKWYVNTTDNDLQYWGLDYPPLTAYHSLLLGYIANLTNPSYVKLHESRGISSPDHKYFMRMTVLFADAMIFLPAMIWYVINMPTIKNPITEYNNLFNFKNKDFILLSALIYPGIMMIDHGHFQYNCISLGFFTAAVTAILIDSFVGGSFFFVLALNYKQMELYHSLPFFFYILGKCRIGKTKSLLLSIYRLVSVSLTVLITFIIIWLPFLKDRNTFMSTVLRLFPFNRGVFEDKVANVWCTINVLYKLRNTFTNEQLAQICLVITTIAVLPVCINLYLCPKKDKFIISLINSSLAFFLFSYQVHEKSILLVSIPVLLYFHNDPLACFWLLLVSHFSMLPLYVKDNLYLAYFATTMFYFLSIIWMWSDLFDYANKSDKRERKFSRGKTNGQKISKHKHYFNKYLFNFMHKLEYHYGYNFIIKTLFYVSMLGMVILSFTIHCLKPPEKYPDLFVLLISVYSCIHFFLFFLYFCYKQFILVDNNFATRLKIY